MDDKVFYLAVASLALAALGLLAHAPNELYLFLGGVYAFLSTVVAIVNRKNDK